MKKIQKIIMDFAESPRTTRHPMSCTYDTEDDTEVDEGPVVGIQAGASLLAEKENLASGGHCHEQSQVRTLLLQPVDALSLTFGSLGVRNPPYVQIAEPRPAEDDVADPAVLMLMVLSFSDCSHCRWARARATGSGMVGSVVVASENCHNATT